MKKTSLHMDVVKWYHDGLQNHCWGFETLHPCKINLCN